MTIENTPDSRACVEHFLNHIQAKDVEADAVLEILGFINNRKSSWLASAVSAALAVAFVCLNVFNNTSDDVRQYRIITLSMAAALVLIVVFTFLMGRASHRHINSPANARAYECAKLFLAMLKKYSKLFRQKGLPDHDFAFESLVLQGKVVAKTVPEWRFYVNYGDQSEVIKASGISRRRFEEMHVCASHFILLPAPEQFVALTRANHAFTEAQVVSGKTGAVV